MHSIHMHSILDVDKCAGVDRMNLFNIPPRILP